MRNCSGVCSWLCAVTVTFSCWPSRRAGRRAEPTETWVFWASIADVTSLGDQLVLGELVRIEPDAHGIAGAEDVDAADALDALDRVLEIDVEISRRGRPRSQLAVGRDQRADHQDARVEDLVTLTPWLLHAVGQLRLRPAAACSAPGPGRCPDRRAVAKVSVIDAPNRSKTIEVM